MNAPVTNLNPDKAKALQAALSQIEKQFGKGSIMRLGVDEQPEDIQVVSTGSLGLDIALGVGGLPRGRVIEIYGPESSGKTTLTLQVVAEMQKLGGVAAFILSPAHTFFGRLVDRTGSFDLGFALAGCLPLLAWVALATLWAAPPTRRDP